MSFYAHTHPAHSSPEVAPKHWEPLFTPFGEGADQCQRDFCEKCKHLDPRHGHLNKVAWWTAHFASSMFAPCSPAAKAAWEWGYLAGLWHDLGKFSEIWQTYLKSKADPHSDDVAGKVDHSTMGALHAVQKHPVLGHLLAYPIAGHHSGLLDATSEISSQQKRLQKTTLLADLCAPPELVNQEIPKSLPFLFSDDYSASFFIRLIFSCLVDADFLATEAFMNPSQARLRNKSEQDVIQELSRLVDAKIDAFDPPASEDLVNLQRKKVVEDCRAAAEMDSGIFSLTVPTGGGKTLSSLSFALRHALKHGHQRIIYVVPFTSIIEQNADVIREIVEPLQTESFTPLIEHHSSLAPEKETAQSRLASENWDAPIIITTAVQFYESLYAAKTSRCRKLHNIANSVVILDEAQSLPVDFLKPCLRVLQELSDFYGTTTVLCTATQPAIHHTEEFPIGLKNCREIIQDTRALFSALKRVEMVPLGDVPDADLTCRLMDHPQALCIVNRRKHAQQLFQMLQGEGNYHLSALMCPQHRSEILAEIRQRLKDKKTTRVISTQLIEAGVDVDFPIVYRAMAGLDSIAQAAGRCNRNGKLLHCGNTYIFRPEDLKGEMYFRETAQVSNQIIDIHSDILGEEAIHHYFDLYYYQQSKRWDSKGIIDQDTFRLDRGSKTFPFYFQYKTAADDFRLIEDRQVPVIIPYDAKAKKLICELGNPSIPLNRELLRGLQRYTVQIPKKARDENIRSLEILRDGQFHALVAMDVNYSLHFGLSFEDEVSSSKTLYCGN